MPGWGWFARLGVGGAPIANAVARFVGTYVSAPVYKGNLGATPTFDLSAGNEQYGTLNANVSAVTLSNPVDGGRYVFILKQDATGGRTVGGWPGNVLWPAGTAPTITATANKYDIVTLLYLATEDVFLAAYAQNY
jgi:hypothetical protein